MNFTNANFTTAVITGNKKVYEGPCMVGNIHISNDATTDPIQIQVFDALTSTGTSVFNETIPANSARTIPGDWRFDVGIYVHFTAVGGGTERVTLQYAPRPSNQ